MTDDKKKIHEEAMAEATLNEARAKADKAKHEADHEEAKKEKTKAETEKTKAETGKTENSNWIEGAKVFAAIATVGVAVATLIVKAK